MNRERLGMVRKIIVSHRDRFHYGEWVCNVDRQLYDKTRCAGDLFTDCDTMGCVAGWTCALFVPRTRGVSIEVKARLALELTEEDAEFLFCGNSGHGLDKVWTSEAKVDEALRRIDILLAQLVGQINI